ICLGVDLEPDEWIKDSGCSKHMMGKICDNKCRVTFSEHDSEITKDCRVIGRGIRNKGLYVMKLGNKPKDQICLATIDENSTLWHRRLGHANMRLIQSLASKELVRNLPKLKFDQHFCDACKMGKQAHASHKAKNIVSTTRCLEVLHMDLFGPSAVRSYGGNSYTLVIVDDYSRKNSTRKVKESLSMTFDETPPPSKTSPLVDDDLDEEEAIRETEKKNLENVVEDETLEIDEIVNIKKSMNHPLENVIGNLNQRTLSDLIFSGGGDTDGGSDDEGSAATNSIMHASVDDDRTSEGSARARYSSSSSSSSSSFSTSSSSSSSSSSSDDSLSSLSPRSTEDGLLMDPHRVLLIPYVGLFESAR
ncbi:retrovirus-related pol polyprotein from transposon TNT 1-94, partial [Tanacetum coccineum]